MLNKEYVYISYTTHLQKSNLHAGILRELKLKFDCMYNISEVGHQTNLNVKYLPIIYIRSEMKYVYRNENRQKTWKKIEINVLR